VSHPAVVELLLVGVRKSPYPVIRKSAARALATKHRDDPRVQRVLEELAGSADAELRKIAEQVRSQPQAR
jgi:hypothetical protein